jgi:hypothetical protein
VASPAISGRAITRALTWMGSSNQTSGSTGSVSTASASTVPWLDDHWNSDVRSRPR